MGSNCNMRLEKLDTVAPTTLKPKLENLKPRDSPTGWVSTQPMSYVEVSV